jgi:hypothetical protein
MAAAALRSRRLPGKSPTGGDASCWNREGLPKTRNGIDGGVSVAEVLSCAFVARWVLKWTGGLKKKKLKEWN